MSNGANGLLYAIREGTGLTAQQLRYFINIGSKYLRKALKKDYPSLKYVNWSELERTLDNLRAKYFEGSVNLKHLWRSCLVQTLSGITEDPEEMLREKNLLLQTLPYWNPTKYKVNIHPLGIPKYDNPTDAEIEFYAFVEPGGHVSIPLIHTLGGKHSSLTGVAPQLQPLPVQVDEMLDADLTPIAYTEWCTYIHYSRISACCERPFGWSREKHQLVCTKCRKETCY